MLLILPTLFSLIKYYNFNENGKKVNITIIQPNIDPYEEKYKIRNIDNISYLKSIITKNNISNSKIILPETFFSEGIQLNSYNYNQFAENLNSIIKKNNNHLITGFEPYEIIYDKNNISAFSNKINNNRWINIFNSALFLNGNNSSFYHKSKLVVGVEKMPYKNIIEPLLGDILLDFGGLSMTRGQQQNRESFYTDKDSYISPIICYESVYGEYVTKYFNKGYGILAIITNDAWWGNSQGHKQHMSYARLRAIENRKNIVRSANTGISGLINSRGDIEIKSNYDEEIVLNYQAYENDKVTFYIMYGDYIFRISLMLSLIIFSYFISSKIRGKN
jgi:apolipoprotein N-acyltransferase